MTLCCLGIRSRSCGPASADRHEFGDVAVEVDQTLVKGGESTLVDPGQLRQVCIGHLPMANDAYQANIGERNAVWPEFVARVSGNVVHQVSCRTGCLAPPDQQTHQAPLRYRTCREPGTAAREPPLSRSMVNVIGYRQGDQDVGVEQRGQSSSSSDRTSSEVTTAPRRITGKPVAGLRYTSAVAP